MSETSIYVRQATLKDVQLVVQLVGSLLTELGGFASFTPEAASELCEQLLASPQYAVFLAFDREDQALGVLTLQVVSALYVAGQLGWIQELYVVPAARSSGVGHQLLEAAMVYAQDHKLQRLEVNTADAEVWPRTVAFYRREGFSGGSFHLRKGW